jgi:branched-chain amino acid transport system permease protein
MVAMLLDSLAAAAIAALLATPMLGIRLLDTAGGLTLSYRLTLVAIAAGVVFVGRLLVLIAYAATARRPHKKTSRLDVYKPKAGQGQRYAMYALLAIALILPWLPWADRNLVDKLTLILIYVMLGVGLNITVGLAGLLDLGYVAFYAIGAYAYALLAEYFGLSFWLCLPLAGLLAAGAGFLLGLPILRLRGDYLAIVTLGFGQIVRIVLINWQSLTGGPNGITGIPRPSFFGLPFATGAAGGVTFHTFFGLSYSPNHRIYFLYYVILALVVLAAWFTQRIRKLPLGRAWEALREDEIACRSLGLNPTTIKLSAFALGASFAGLAGSFFATRQGFISPESFTFLESAIILAIVVLGGMGSLVGIVLAAILLVGLPEWIRDLEQYRMLVFGGAMVLIMLWRPQGLLAQRTVTVRLPEAQAAPAPS